MCLELLLLSRCTGSAALRTQPFSELHPHSSASRGPGVGPSSPTPYPDTLQKPSLGLVPAPASAPALLPAPLPAFATSHHLLPPPLLRPLPFLASTYTVAYLKKMQTCGAPCQGFCLTSQLLEPEFPESRDDVSASHPFFPVRCSSFRERFGRWGQCNTFNLLAYIHTAAWEIQWGCPLSA